MSLSGYDYWGLRLSANEAWPALAPFRSAAGNSNPDAHIETARRPLPARSTEVIVDSDQVQFQVAGVGRYTICAGRTIEVVAEPGAPIETLELFLFGSAWGALCYQRGILPLHASVVAWGEEALAFCGPSGAGKSTLVASLIEGGGRLVSDDLCRCDPDAGLAPLVWPSLPRLKLWRETLTALHRPAVGLVQDLPTEDKFLWPLPEGGAAGPLPVRAIYLLEWGPLALERLYGVQAVRQFVPAAIYRADLLDRMGRLAQYWQSCAQVMRRVRVYRLSRPKDWSSLAAVARLLDLG